MSDKHKIYIKCINLIYSMYFQIDKRSMQVDSCKSSHNELPCILLTFYST